VADFLAITSVEFPKSFQSSYEGYALRPLATTERTSIEDWMFRKGLATTVPTPAFAAIIPDTRSATLPEYSMLAEFSLSFLVSEGRVPVSASALLDNGKCTAASTHRVASVEQDKIEFSKSMRGSAVPQWLSRCHFAYISDSRRMQITATRYLRHIYSEDLAEGLLDLCISLESLLEAQTEISFKFATCLIKVTGQKGQHGEELSSLLTELYDLRSKIVHGDPAASKTLKRVQESYADLRGLSKQILVTYILYVSEHTRKEWGSYIRKMLFE
jgi:hypothetical protein